MNKMNRRAAVTMALASGATLATTSKVSATGKTQEEDVAPTKDQTYVMDAGMTREEADCWKVIAEAAAAFFALPEQHPLDKSEVATAIHVIQNKLLSRPTYRKYLELAKAGFEEQQNEK